MKIGQICLLVWTFSMSANGNNVLIGTTQDCSNEGGRVFPSSISTIHCFSCMCKHGQVECQKNICDSENGCFMIQNEYADSKRCCKKCKGCYYHGEYHDSGTEWKDDANPCLTISCKAGVISEAKVQCYTPCSNPMTPRIGECCPTCPDCKISGQHFSTNTNLTLLEDPCLKCRCLDGRMTCSKRACPVLQCPPSAMQWKPGECCPTCNGTRKIESPPKGSCLLGKELYSAGMTIRHDRCTYCSCMNSTSVCKRETCPPMDCPLEKQIYLNHDQCCPQCPSQPENKTICIFQDKFYQNGDKWQANECKSCLCDNGHIRCAIEECPNVNAFCPPNMKLHRDPGACCPRCVEADGVCTVFGDPHYRTFDGKFFSFQGSCKYQLVADCVSHTFSIRVTNDARKTKTSSWTKTITIRIGKLKVNLGEKMRIKVNRERISIPYRKENMLSIYRTSDAVIVETFLGLKILWDGNSFIEVSVPINYKGKLCGLCGNYNSILKDDFITRDGRMVYDTDEFASSWQVGGRKACSRPESKRRVPCGNPHRKIKDRLCKPLRGEIFSACHEKLNPDVYYRSCVTDMCECPGKRCYCESLTAYAHECQRMGILLPDWKNLTGCSARRNKRH